MSRRIHEVLLECQSDSGAPQEKLFGFWVDGRALLEGEGAIGEIPERLQSGHRGCEAVGGRLLAVGTAVGAGVGVWECLWGRVRAGVLGGRGSPPPPVEALVPSIFCTVDFGGVFFTWSRWCATCAV